jgi:hypothetical protein
MGILSGLVGGFVGFLVGGPAGAVAGFALGMTKPAEQLVNKALDIILSPFMSAFGTPDASAGQAQYENGVLITRTANSTDPIPIIYGVRKKGGLIVYAETGPKGVTGVPVDNRYLFVAYVFSEGPVEGLNAIMIDDIDIDGSYIPLLNSGQTVTMSEKTDSKGQKTACSKFAGRVTMRFSKGVYFNLPPASGTSSSVDNTSGGQLNYGGGIFGISLDNIFATVSNTIKSWYTTNYSRSPLGADIKNGIFKDAPNFKDSNIFNGLATLFVRYEWLEIKTPDDQKANPFNNGSIPDLQAIILGRKVAPILSANTGGSEISDSSLNPEYGGAGYVERFSYNPAEILLDYLRNPRYGKGLKNSDIHWQSFYTAKNKCNTNVKYYTPKVGSTEIEGPIMSCSAVMDSGKTLFENTKILLSGMRGYMPYIQGRYKLKIEDAGHPTDILSGQATLAATCVSSPAILAYDLEVNTYEIVGDVSYSGIDRSSKYNQVVVSYVDPDSENKWSVQQVVYPELETDRQYFTNLDGGRENKLDITFPTVINFAQAKDFARLLFNKSRYQEQCSLTVTSHAFELEPGDQILIQSTILNFYASPWRVISIQPNDDYTFRLNCLRNPDFLYPYARVGEPDRIASIYIPRGVSVYQPPEQNIVRYGVNPPTRAQDTGNNDTLYNPTGTDPTGANGGGLGDGSNSPVNTTPPNDRPRDAGYIPPMTDIADITNVNYVTEGTLIFADLTIRLPTHPMCNGVELYWALGGIAKNYQTKFYEASNGPGATITARLGPLAGTSVSQADSAKYTYRVNVRVRYSTGETSTKFFYIELNPISKTLQGQNPSETNWNFVAASWPVPGTIAPAAKDSVIARFEGLLVPNTSPRTLRLTLTQETIKQTINYDVTGVNIYYKLSTDTTWFKSSNTFAPGYFPGNPITFDFKGSIGNYNDGANTYNFIFVLTYANEVESSNYTPYTMNVQSATTSYDPFYGQLNLDIAYKPGAVPVTISTATAGNIQLGIGSAGAGLNYVSSTGSYQFFLDPPATGRQFWVGQTIRYRALVTGQTFTAINYKYVLINGSGYVGPLDIPNMNYNTPYEIVISPVTAWAGGVGTDANVSLYGKGYIPSSTNDPNYQSTGQYKGVFKFENISTTTALAAINQPYVNATPTVGVTSLKYTGTALNPTTATTQVNKYISLTYSVPTGLSGYVRLNVYRRHRNTWTGDATNNSGYCKFYGFGQWEKITQSGSAGSSYTLNLRLPTSFSWFDPYYEVPGYGNRTLKASVIGQPIGLAPVLSGFTSSGFMELLLIVETSTGESAQGVLMQIKPAFEPSLSTIDLLTGTSGVVPKTITCNSEPGIRTSDFTVGYLRRLTEANAVLTTSQISYNSTYVATGAYPSGTLSSSYPSASPSIQ